MKKREQNNVCFLFACLEALLSHFGSHSVCFFESFYAICDTPNEIREFMYFSTSCRRDAHFRASRVTKIEET